MDETFLKVVQIIIFQALPTSGARSVHICWQPWLGVSRRSSHSRSHKLSRAAAKKQAGHNLKDQKKAAAAGLSFNCLICKVRSQGRIGGCSEGGAVGPVGRHA